MTTHKDLIGQDIQIGDWVVHTGGHYASGSIERVVKLTAKMVTTVDKRYYPSMKTKYGLIQGTSKNPDALLVVTQQMGKTKEEPSDQDTTNNGGIKV